MENRFENWKRPEIEHGKLTKWNWVVQHPENLELGKKTDIGSFTYINAKNGVILEDDVQVGSHCSIYSISTIDGEEGKVVLKKNARVGSHTTITPGVTIGENSIIGAHSFINKDIPNNVVAFGVPAKVVKKLEDKFNLSKSEEKEVVDNKWKVLLFKTHSDEEDVKAVSSIIRRGSFWTDGPEVKEFEKGLAESLGVKHAVTMNSGTSVLLALLLAHKVEGGEVIVPSFTFTSTVNTIVLAGAKPVFAEIEPETYGLDYEDVLSRVNSATKAIIVVHYAGSPARDTLHLRRLCDERGIILIEDAAEAQEATINGRKVGTIGNSAMISFCQSKIIATGEGGAAFTNLDKIKEEICYIRSHGRKEDPELNYFQNPKSNDYVSLGHNFRMSTMCAALGLSQLKKVDKLIGLRKEKARLLSEGLRGIAEVKVPTIFEGMEHVFQLYTIRLSSYSIREGLQDYLTSKGIMSKVYFNPIHLTSYYRKMYKTKEGDLPLTEEISNTILSLPFYPDLKEEEIDFIVKEIRNYFRK